MNGHCARRTSSKLANRGLGAGPLSPRAAREYAYHCLGVHEGEKHKWTNNFAFLFCIKRVVLRTRKSRTLHFVLPLLIRAMLEERIPSTICKRESGFLLIFVTECSFSYTSSGYPKNEKETEQGKKGQRNKKS